MEGSLHYKWLTYFKENDIQKKLSYVSKFMIETWIFGWTDMWQNTFTGKNKKKLVWKTEKKESSKRVNSYNFWPLQYFDYVLIFDYQVCFKAFLVHVFD